MLAYDDVDHDTHLNLNEFYAAFSKLYSKPPIVSFFPFSLSDTLGWCCCCRLDFSLSLHFLLTYKAEPFRTAKNMHINVLDVDVCVCRCWIVMAERGIENKSTDISFLFIFIYLAGCCAPVSLRFIRRNTRQHFTPVKSFWKRDKPRRLGLFTLSCLFFRFVLSLSFSWFSVLAFIWRSSSAVPWLERERERRRAFESFFVSHPQWDRLMHRYRTTQCASRPFDLYTMCALREHTVGAPASFLFSVPALDMAE